MIHFSTPGKTEMGADSVSPSAGEQPIKGYLGGAHQDDGQGVGRLLAPCAHLFKLIGLIDPSCLKKRIRKTAGRSRKLVSKEPGALHPGQTVPRAHRHHRHTA